MTQPSLKNIAASFAKKVYLGDARPRAVRFRGSVTRTVGSWEEANRVGSKALKQFLHAR